MYLRSDSINVYCFVRSGGNGPQVSHHQMFTGGGCASCTLINRAVVLSLTALRSTSPPTPASREIALVGAAVPAPASIPRAGSPDATSSAQAAANVLSSRRSEERRV